MISSIVFNDLQLLINNSLAALGWLTALSSGLVIVEIIAIALISYSCNRSQLVCIIISVLVSIKLHPPISIIITALLFAISF